MIKSNKLRSLIEGYVDREDGTILDIKNNLIWQKAGPVKKYCYRDAKKYCKDLRLGGYADWRLPTMKELLSLYKKENKYKINRSFQHYKHVDYWSCSPNGAYRMMAISYYDDNKAPLQGSDDKGLRGEYNSIRAVRKNKQSDIKRVGK